MARKSTDLSAYKKPATPRPTQAPEPVLTPENAKPRSRVSKVIGRPPKPKEEKRDQKVTLSLTQAEKAVVVKKAGLAPEATFLLAELRKAGVFD